MRKSFQLNFEWDIVQIRSEVREMAKEMGFDELDQSRIVQSFSELARNVIQHAEEGEIILDAIEEEGRKGFRIQVQDTGPGITNLKELTQGTNQVGETTGLQLVEFMMDELRQIPVECGTCLEAIKWLNISQLLNET